MTKVFMSYRRADSQWAVDAMFGVLRQHFGKGSVFLDVDDIPPGVDFRVYLKEQLTEADVVLVIIGPEWERIMKERADTANDFVRIEVETALKHDKLVVPVLVMDTEIPDFSSLPKTIQDLQWRNLSRIRRQPDLDNDCARLVSGIKKALNFLDKSPKLKSVKDVTTAVSEFLPDIRTEQLEMKPAPINKLSAGGMMPNTRTEPLSEERRKRLVSEALQQLLNNETSGTSPNVLPDVETELLEVTQINQITNKVYYLQGTLEELHRAIDWTDWTAEERARFEDLLYEDIIESINAIIRIMDGAED